MKKTSGVIGYFLLLISAVYIDTPFIGVLALGSFLAGLVLIIQFYLGLRDKKKTPKWLYVSLIISGTLLLFLLLGFTAVSYNQYLVLIDRNTVIENLPLTKKHTIIIILLNLIAFTLIIFGIKDNPSLSRFRLFLITVPSLVVIPVTLILIRLTYALGIWLGGS
jgi:hypothetical protein